MTMGRNLLQGRNERLLTAVAALIAAAIALHMVLIPVLSGSLFFDVFGGQNGTQTLLSVLPFSGGFLVILFALVVWQIMQPNRKG